MYIIPMHTYVCLDYKWMLKYMTVSLYLLRLSICMGLGGREPAMNGADVTNIV